MQDTQGAEPNSTSPTLQDVIATLANSNGPTFQDALTALNGVLPKPKDGSTRSDHQIVMAALNEINRLREYAALPIAAEVPESTPGWRELSYEEPPYGKDVLFRRDGGTPYVGQSVKPDPDDDPDGDHGLLIRIDGDLYDGDPPEFWSEIPDYYYDDVAAIGATLDGDEPDDVDTVADDDSDDSDADEVYYREIDDNPPPVGELVLLLTAIADEDNEGEIHANDPVIGWCGDDGIYYTEDGGQDVEIDEPTHWSPLPRLPDIDSDDS